MTCCLLPCRTEADSNAARVSQLHGRQANGALEGALRLGAVRKLALPPSRSAASAQQGAGLWGALGSVVGAVRPQADARRPAARALQFAATRDGSALRLYVLSASTLKCWQVRSRVRPRVMHACEAQG